MTENTVWSEMTILGKVQKLYERADHPNTGPEEREACIRKADSLMLKYQIDQAMLDALRKPEERRTVINEKFEFSMNADFESQFATMLTALGAANNVRVAVHWNGTATLVGFREDVEWLKILILQVFREFLVRISPSWDDNLSIDANVKTLKEAAWKWQQIAHQMRLRGLWPEGKLLPPKDGGYLIRAYKRECSRLGVPADVQTQNHEGYRYAFIDAFTNRIATRAADILRQKKEAAEERGSGAELAIRDAGSFVDDEFFRLFPSLSPEARARRIEEAREANRRERERDAAFLASLSEKERAAELRRREREYNRAMRGMRSITYDNDGARSGRRAAESVSLQRSNGVNNSSKKEIG